MYGQRISIRVPDAICELADALIPLVRNRREYYLRTAVRRSDVMRLALAIGLDTLREQYAQRESERSEQ